MQLCCRQSNKKEKRKQEKLKVKAQAAYIPGPKDSIKTIKLL